MSGKINMGENRAFTRDQLASALTIIIGNRILKPSVKRCNYTIEIEYKYRKRNKTMRFRYALSEIAMQLFNGTVEAYIYNMRVQIKKMMLKEEGLNDE